MGTGQSELSMVSQATNTSIQVANSTVSTILMLLLKERAELTNPEALIVDDKDLENVLKALNEEGIVWTAATKRYPIYELKEDGTPVLDKDGKPVITGYKEEYERTPDGKSHIIMVSGHDRALMDPETGEMIRTNKGNVKMVGGNIDRAAEIRNQIREARIEEELKDRDIPTDDAYKSDWVKMEFPGLEARARFATDLRDRTSLECLRPMEWDKRDLYIRQDAFVREQDGRAPIVESTLKEYFFMEQFEDYYGHLKTLDERIQKTHDYIERANFGQDGEKYVLCNPVKGYTEDVRIEAKEGFICGKSYNLTIPEKRQEFFDAVCKTGHTYIVKGEPDIEFEKAVTQDSLFRDTQNMLRDFMLDHPEALDAVHIELKDGDKTIDPQKGEMWTEIQVHIDNTALVANLEVDGAEEYKPIADMLKEAKEVHVEKAVTVTTIDGDSMSAARAAQEYVSGTEALVREELETKEQDIDAPKIQEETLKPVDTHYEETIDYGFDEKSMDDIQVNNDDWGELTEVNGEFPFPDLDAGDQEPTNTER